MKIRIFICVNNKMSRQLQDIIERSDRTEIKDGYGILKIARIGESIEVGLLDCADSSIDFSYPKHLTENDDAWGELNGNYRLVICDIRYEKEGDIVYKTIFFECD